MARAIRPFLLRNPLLTNKRTVAFEEYAVVENDSACGAIPEDC